MSDFSEYEDDPQDEGTGPAGLREHAKRLEAQAKAAAEEATQLKRELAFAKAGLDLSDPKMTYFVKGYDGDATPEAIRSAAEAAGFIGETTPTIPAQELQEHQAAANLAGGGFIEPPDTSAEYNAAMAAARTKEEVLAVMDRYGSLRTGLIPQ